MLLLHIFIAVSSIAFSSYLLFTPTKRNFQISYILVGATIASGTYLVVVEPAHMIQACTSGLVYIAVTLVTTAVAHRRASVRISNK